MNENTTKSNALTTILNEYNIVSNSRERYMKSYTETNFYFGLIVVSLTIGIWKFDWIFLILPFMVIIQYSIVQWNQYHQFLAEIYLSKLEEKINSLVLSPNQNDVNINYYSFYNHLFTNSILYKDQRGILPLIKPTAILSLTLLIVNLTIFVFSVQQGFQLLKDISYFPFSDYLFLFTCYFIFALLLYNFIRMPKSMKPTLINIFNEKYKKFYDK